MQVGTTKDQSLYNKPSDAVNPGALAAGTLPQYNTITEVIVRMKIQAFWDVMLCSVTHSSRRNETCAVLSKRQ